MKKIKFRKLQKLPPLLFPIWLLVFSLDRLVKLFFWLLGFWHCYSCKQRKSPFDKPYNQVYQEGDTIKKGIRYHTYKRRHICEDCYNNLLREKDKLERYKQSGGQYYG